MYRIRITPPKEARRSSAPHHQPTHDVGGQAVVEPRARKAADAELLLFLFEGLQPLALSGFSVWDNGPEGFRVGFPTRRFRGYSHLLLRDTDPDARTAYERLKGEILDAFHAFKHAGATGMEAAS